ncbi:MAG: response regulator [Tindallia sp. MSAO_Bac2]|nr:MAG: response regulator [Tindallia sp. MSAO_Bac2]
MLRMMLDKVNAGIILLDENYQIHFWNSWLEQYSGISGEFAVGKPIMEILQVFEKPYYQAMFHNTLANHQNMFFSGAFHPVFVEPYHNENRFVKQNLQLEPLIHNDTVWIMLQIEDTSNQYKRVHKLNEKIEAIRKTQKALKISEERAQQLAREARDANEAKSRFLAHMSHEIRTPLNGIIGYMQLLGSSPLTRRQKEYVNYASVSARSLLTIVNDILDFSKIEANKMELDIVATDLNQVCDEAVEMLQFQAKDKGLRLYHEFDLDTSHIVRVDPVRLKQILVNLLSNAIKFTKEGSVVLKVRHQDIGEGKGTYLFEVVDTGIGISPEQQQRLFKAFSQADNSTTREYGGTGLGLVISKHLASMMNSYIEFESEPGQGSRFYFKLVLDKAEMTDGDEAVETVEIMDICRSRALNASDEPTILAADDVPMNLQLVSEMIRKCMPKANVIHASDGQQALEMLQTSNVDLVLMDIQMPGMDGLEVTRRIRQLENRCDDPIPVIALSAGVTTDERIECMDAGMDDFLGKPVQQDKLMQVLSKYLGVESQCPDQEIPGDNHNDHFNRNRLMKQLGHSEESFQIIAETANSHFPEAIGSLKEALDQKDTEKVLLTAHALKGASMNLAMDRLAEIFLEMEKMARNEDDISWEELEEWLQEVEVEWNIVRNLINEREH